MKGILENIEVTMSLDNVWTDIAGYSITLEALSDDIVLVQEAFCACDPKYGYDGTVESLLSQLVDDARDQLDTSLDYLERDTEELKDDILEILVAKATPFCKEAILKSNSLPQK